MPLTLFPINVSSHPFSFKSYTVLIDRYNSSDHRHLGQLLAFRDGAGLCCATGMGSVRWRPLTPCLLAT
jgi:hypothetical protein